MSSVNLGPATSCHNNSLYLTGSPSIPQAYSVHSYGKTGFQLWQLAAELDMDVNAVHTPNSTQGGVDLPIIFTEHNTKTTGDFGVATTTLDSFSEASRLAAQLVYLGRSGYDSYVFKATTTEASRGGVAKTGLYWRAAAAHASRRFTSFPESGVACTYARLPHVFAATTGVALPAPPSQLAPPLTPPRPCV